MQDATRPQLATLRRDKIQTVLTLSLIMDVG
jgi:hypothetical protein